MSSCIKVRIQKLHKWKACSTFPSLERIKAANFVCCLCESEDSQVGSLTSKGQVGVLLGEHRGWILRMAFGKNRGATWTRHSF